MPLRNVRYRIRTIPNGMRQRLAFRNGKVVEVKNLPPKNEVIVPPHIRDGGRVRGYKRRNRGRGRAVKTRIVHIPPIRHRVDRYNQFVG